VGCSCELPLSDRPSVGTRHIKVWHVDEVPKSTAIRRSSDSSVILGSPSNRTLPGRNCLLGDFLDRTFTAIEASSSYCAYVTTHEGDICRLNIEASAPTLTRVYHLDTCISALQLSSRDHALLLGCGSGALYTCPLEQLSDPDGYQDLLGKDVVQDATEQVSNPSILGLATMHDGRVVSLDSAGGIRVLEIQSGASAKPGMSGNQKYEAHRSGILGLQLLDEQVNPGMAFLAWSSDGTISMWDFEGACVHSTRLPPRQGDWLADHTQNEIRALQVFGPSLTCVSGDRRGMLRSVYHTIFFAWTL